MATHLVPDDTTWGSGALGRIPIRLLAPQQPENRWPAKAYLGEVVPFEATVFREGHGELGVELLLTDPEGRETRHPMSLLAPGTDRWRAELRLETIGRYRFRVRAWADEWASWLHDATIKVGAGDDTELMLRMGAELLEGSRSKVLAEAREALGNRALTPSARLKVATDPRVVRALATAPVAALVTTSEELSLRVERERAAVGAWYEFFPRSEGAKKHRDGSWTSGTFRTAAKRLPAVAEMGFDVVYLPPIHPIGHSFRKGPNNSPKAGPNDPGSPWAIGDETGGHDAIHPDLGTAADFRYFVAQAEKLGLEVALDLALQCSPDHPWVTSHPEWFTQRPDGSIAYAENPPKKYQDIYPINFDRDPEGLRAEVLRIVEHWIGQGVKIFRVDNPHTKPLAFWEWLLAEVDRTTSGGRLPRRGVHPSRDAAVARRCGVPAVVHLLHLAQHEGGARGVPRRPRPRDCRLPAPEPVREHPRHPHRVPAVRGSGRLQDPGRDRRDGLAELGRLCGLRTVRGCRPPRQRREHRQREVRVQGARLGEGRRRRSHPGAVPDAAELDPVRASGPGPAAQPRRALERR